MKNIPLFSILLLSMISCSTKNIDAETLPKDIALKKELNENYPIDSANMSNMKKEILSRIAENTCSDVAEWKISPLGSKPCGGPASYIAYPIKIEAEILPKIKNYTIEQSGFNEKYGIKSDCMMVQEPATIICENGKAVLVQE